MFTSKFGAIRSQRLSWLNREAERFPRNFNSQVYNQIRVRWFFPASPCVPIMTQHRSLSFHDLFNLIDSIGVGASIELLLVSLLKKLMMLWKHFKNSSQYLWGLLKFLKQFIELINIVEYSWDGFFFPKN